MDSKCFWKGSSQFFPGTKFLKIDWTEKLLGRLKVEEKYFSEIKKQSKFFENFSMENQWKWKDLEFQNFRDFQFSLILHWKFFANFLNIFRSQKIIFFEFESTYKIFCRIDFQNFGTCEKLWTPFSKNI